MLSETLATGLGGYRIGPKIRMLRQKKDLGLVQLGEHTGLSSGMLSKIERGQLFPTLPTLLKIAMFFGVSLEHFFVDQNDVPLKAVVRKNDRLRLPDRPGKESPSYFFESLDFPVADRKMEAYYAEFDGRSEPTESHKHKGAEFIYVMRGQLIVTIEGEDTMLEAGDSMYFDPAYAHIYRRAGRASCSAIVVVAR
ncbi:MAG: helix-turn-helix domain-containing protein [Aestuariivirga sp.]